jgi:hypothetical protein
LLIAKAAAQWVQSGAIDFSWFSGKITTHDLYQATVIAKLLQIYRFKRLRSWTSTPADPLL